VAGERSPSAGDGEPKQALRAVIRGEVQGVGFRETTRRLATRAGVLGWVRNREDGSVHVHAEGSEAALAELTAFLRSGPRTARVSAIEIETARAEGHEQFAIRGVSAGTFHVFEHPQRPRRFELVLEVTGGSRAWALPKEPSLDPSAKRLAVEVPTQETSAASAWDSGTYEQGGRVPWPAALERGHAVFVLHGGRVRGGFALQRIRDPSDGVWLLVKRRDEHSTRASDA
jgi:acylphosphatase